MKENGYMTRPQSLEKIKNIAKVQEYFDRNGGTTKEISKALGIPKSSVQRYLNAAEDPNVRQLIKEYLAANKYEGNRKGGQTSQEKYGYGKDEFGHFTGKGK
jgi:predicted transcriptional regulator